MTPRQRETFPPVTLAHIRGHGCCDLLVYCNSVWCNHTAVINADWLSDETPVRSLADGMHTLRLDWRGRAARLVATDEQTVVIAIAWGCKYALNRR